SHGKPPVGGASRRPRRHCPLVGIDAPPDEWCSVGPLDTIADPKGPEALRPKQPQVVGVSVGDQPITRTVHRANTSIATPTTSHGWKKTMSIVNDAAAPMTVDQAHTEAGRNPTAAMAASAKDASVTANRAKPNIRSVSDGAPSGERIQERVTSKGHVGPPTVAAGRGDRKQAWTAA